MHGILDRQVWLAAVRVSKRDCLRRQAKVMAQQGAELPTSGDELVANTGQAKPLGPCLFIACQARPQRLNSRKWCNVDVRLFKAKAQARRVDFAEDNGHADSVS